MMSLLLAQTFDQHLNRARLFEHVGYWLAGLAFVILVGAVLWRVSQRCNGPARRIFRIVYLAGLTLLQVALGAGLLIHFWGGSHSSPQRRGGRVVPVTQVEPPKTAALVMHVDADGTMSANGRIIPGDELKTYLVELTGSWADRGIRPENVEVDLRIDPQASTGNVIETLDTFFNMGITQVRWGTGQVTRPDSQVSVDRSQP